MAIFAETIHLESQDLLTWLAIGLAAGWLAGVVMRGGGFGLLGDIAVGLAGALAGGLLFSVFSPGPQPFATTGAVAFIGACVLIGGARALAGRRAHA